ncbi:MAG: sigma-70 family RNA polymerase sigma factor [Candidatus Omnitrophica bacterium]|nr:sigma-70 family RNA polymerase sigma factor [Candidatus Omnitrophota bacterium]
MDDLEFVQRCVAADKKSWDEFVNKYSRLIYNYIHSVLKIKGYPATEEAVNDLFQEIILALVKDNFKRLRTFKGRNGCSLASWLRQVSVNFTIDYIRRLKPAVSIDEEDGAELSLREILPDESAGIRVVLSHKERLLRLAECVEALGRDDKYFLELHINRGLALEDLMGHLRVSRGAIDMRKSRLMERLRECFKSKGFALDL